MPLLIEHRANTDLKSKTGDTALVLAAHQGRQDLVEILLKSGATATPDAVKCQLSLGHSRADGLHAGAKNRALKDLLSSAVGDATSTDEKDAPRHSGAKRKRSASRDQQDDDDDGDEAMSSGEQPSDDEDNKGDEDESGSQAGDSTANNDDEDDEDGDAHMSDGDSKASSGKGSTSTSTSTSSSSAKSPDRPRKRLKVRHIASSPSSDDAALPPQAARKQLARKRTATAKERADAAPHSRRRRAAAVVPQVVSGETELALRRLIAVPAMRQHADKWQSRAAGAAVESALTAAELFACSACRRSACACRQRAQIGRRERGSGLRAQAVRRNEAPAAATGAAGRANDRAAVV